MENEIFCLIAFWVFHETTSDCIVNGPTALILKTKINQHEVGSMLPRTTYGSIAYANPLDVKQIT